MSNYKCDTLPIACVGCPVSSFPPPFLRVFPQSQSPATSFFGLLQNFAYFKWIPKLAFS